MAIGIGRVGWRNFVSAPTNNPLWDNLKAYYTGDNTANDSKGTYNGTLTNGATYGTGKIGSAFSFDGINDYVELGDVMDLGLNSRSFSIWFKASSSTGTLFSKSISGPGSGRFSAGISGNKLNLFFNGGGGDHVIITTNTVNLNTWYNAVFIIDRNDKLKIYLNGILQDVSILQGQWSAGTNNLISYSSINYDNSFPFRIGSYNDSGQVQHLFSGLLDEFGIWDRALTAAEVAELYNGGAGKQYVAPAYTTRTTAFATATGITDTTILNALNTFDTGLISNGLDTKMKALYPFVGGTANTHKFNFMDARDLNVAYRLAFNGGWIHSSTGAKPNGTNGYADTFLNNNTMGQNNVSVGVYLGDDNTKGGGTSCAIGSFNGGGTWIYSGINNGGAYVSINSSSSTILSTNTDGKSRGLYLISKTTSDSFYSVRGNLANTVFTTNTYVSTPFKIAANGAYEYGDYSAQQKRLAYIGDGLTPSEATAFYTLVQTLQTALSRQV